VGAKRVYACAPLLLVLVQNGGGAAAAMPAAVGSPQAPELLLEDDDDLDLDGERRPGWGEGLETGTASMQVLGRGGVSSAVCDRPAA
jgi:hypothetical protein